MGNKVGLVKAINQSEMLSHVEIEINNNNNHDATVAAGVQCEDKAQAAASIRAALDVCFFFFDLIFTLTPLMAHRALLPRQTRTARFITSRSDFQASGVLAHQLMNHLDLCSAECLFGRLKFIWL